MTIRSATPADEQALGRYGAALMREHHAADPRRFILAPHPEKGYGRFLVSELPDPDVIVQVAEEAGKVVGYIFAALEPMSWKDLRGPCGYVHDVYVDADTRQRGVGRELVNAALAWFRSRGMSQVVLTTRPGNEAAKRLFANIGFRATMVEMTLDLANPEA